MAQRLLLYAGVMKWLALTAILLSACTFTDTGDFGPDVGDADDKRDEADPPKEPSEDPTPEPDPRPDPDPGPAPCNTIETELLIDSNFDNGGVEWIEDSPYELITDLAPLAAHSPDYVAWLGGYPFGTDRVLQPLLVPSQAISLTLHAQLATDTPLPNFDEQAKLTVELWDMEFNTLEVIETRMSGDINNDWQSFEWDIEGFYNGQAIMLVFELDTEFDAMSVLVDSVELRATVCDE